MPKRKNTPEWTKTGVVWETKVLIWGRMAKGDTDTQVGEWLDQQLALKGNGTLHLDRNTISSVRKELEELPGELAKGLPENIYGHWHSIQKHDEKPSPVINTQLLPNNAAEKSNTCPVPPVNDGSESPQIKDEHFEQHKKQSTDMDAQPSPTITEAIKRESLPPEDAVTEPNTKVNDSESSETPSKERVTPSPEKKSDICLSPPDNINVVTLKSWRVPTGEAPEIILSWRSWHRQGRHDICQLFPQFHEDILTRKVPFKTAKAILNLGIRAIKFDDEKLRQYLDAARVYHPWKNKNNQNALYKEIDELDKPISEVRKKHLKDIKNLLEELRETVLGALETKKYDSLLKMEENPLFESLQKHCWDVYTFFWDLKRNLETAQYLKSDTKTSEIDKTMDNSKAKELLKLQKDTITSLKQLRKAIDISLRTKSYSKEWCPDCSHDATADTSS